MFDVILEKLNMKRKKSENNVDYKKLHEIIIRILDRSKFYEISRNRITKTLFLIDWKLLIGGQKRILDIDWRVGRLHLDLIDILKEIESQNNPYVSYDVDAYRLKRDDESYQLLSEHHKYEKLNEEELHAIDLVMYHTDKMTYKPFMEYLNSNYALLDMKKNTKIDIVAKANEYLSRIK